MGKKKQRGAVAVGAKAPTADKNGIGDNATKAKAKANFKASESSSGSDIDIGLLFAIVVGLPFCFCKLLVWTVLSIPSWALLFILWPMPICGGRPPTLQSWSQSWRFLTRYTWGNPKLLGRRKLFLTLAILEHTIKSPMFAVCWMVDEILYGKQFQGIKLGEKEEDGVDMVFVVSGYRSASTHLARSLLEQDESESTTTTTTSDLSFVSPNSMMMSVPYLWMWNFVSWFVGDLTETEKTGDSKTKKETEAETETETAKQNTPPSLHPTLSKSQVRSWYREKYSAECLERHDFDPFAVDTLDLSFLSCHLNGLAWQYCLDSSDPEVVWKEFQYAKHIPENQQLYEVDFLRHIDRLARKTILFRQSTSTSSSTSTSNKSTRTRTRTNKNKNSAILFKGHFLSIVPALVKQYPGAKFVTVLRDPCDRLKSAINYTAVNPSISGAMNRRNHEHWKVLATTLEETEAEYCLRELETFDSGNSNGNGQDSTFLSIHYDALAPSRKIDTISAVQRWLLGNEGSVPSASSGKRSIAKNKNTSVGSTSTVTSKKTKKPKKYKVDKTLHEVGIDEVAYRNRLVAYTNYMKEIGSKKKIA